MKRDDDLIRKILLSVEAAEGTQTLDGLDVTGYERAVIAYHLQLLQEAGYVIANFAYGDNVVQQALIDRLTWDGHEFLDAVRSEGVWAQTKSTIASTVGSTSLEVVKAVAAAVTLKMIGM